MRSGGLVVSLPDLTEAHVVDDEQVGPGPGLESQGVGIVGQAGVEIGEQVDAAGVAQGDALDAGAQAEGFEHVALAGARLARDDKVVVTLNKAELGELQDKAFVECGLKVPIEGCEGLLLD